jgi:hypothetical protein
VTEVPEFQRIPDEEHGRVVSDQVPVAFVGVELQGEDFSVTIAARTSRY